MKFCRLIILSKNKQAISKFINICIKNKTILTVLHFLKKQKRKKFLTILKSPHINKDAQEQFEEKLILNSIRVKSYNFNKFLLLLKKIFITCSPEIKILIQFKTKKDKTFKFLKLSKNIHKFFITNTNKIQTFDKNNCMQMLQNAKNRLKQFENYGFVLK